MTSLGDVLENSFRQKSLNRVQTRDLTLTQVNYQAREKLNSSGKTLPQTRTQYLPRALTTDVSVSVATGAGEDQRGSIIEFSSRRIRTVNVVCSVSAPLHHLLQQPSPPQERHQLETFHLKAAGVLGRFLLRAVKINGVPQGRERARRFFHLLFFAFSSIHERLLHQSQEPPMV